MISVINSFAILQPADCSILDRTQQKFQISASQDNQGIMTRERQTQRHTEIDRDRDKISHTQDLGEEF